MRAGKDQAHIRIVCRHIQPPCPEQTILATGQQKFRDFPGKGRLANPARAGDQPARMQPSRPVCLKKVGLCAILSEELRRFPRVRRAFDPVRFWDGIIAHA